MKKYLFKIGVIIILTVALTRCKPEQPAELLPDTYCLSEAMKKNVKIQEAKSQLVAQEFPLTGRVEYNPDKVIHFVSLVGGIITNTYFSLGEKVSKGQLLAEIRSTELSNLQAEKKTVQSQLLVASRHLESIQAMHTDGIASQKDLLEAQSNVDILKAQLERTESQLALFSASQERHVFQINAPTAGIIVSKRIAAGTQISAEADPLFTISDLSEVWVMVNIYAGNVTNIKPGMKVTIKTLSYSDEVFTGKINTISQVFDSEERVLKARIVMENPGIKLMPGMLVDVAVKKETETEAIAVPSNALIFDNNRNYLVVYNSDCDLRVKNVDILSKNNGTTFISGGVDEGEKIVTQNHLLIYDQVKKKDELKGQ